MSKGLAEFNRVINVAFEDYLACTVGKIQPFDLKEIRGSVSSTLRELKRCYDASFLTDEERKIVKELIRALIFEELAPERAELPIILNLSSKSADVFFAMRDLLSPLSLREIFLRNYDRKLYKEFMDCIKYDRDFLTFNLESPDVYLTKTYLRIWNILINIAIERVIIGEVDKRKFLSGFSYFGAIDFLNFYKKLKKIKFELYDKGEDKNFVCVVSDKSLGIYLTIGYGELLEESNKMIVENTNTRKILSDSHNPNWYYQDLRFFEWHLFVDVENERLFKSLFFFAYLWVYLANSYMVKFSEFDYKKLAGFSQCKAIDENMISFVDELKDIDVIVKANI